MENIEQDEDQEECFITHPKSNVELVELQVVTVMSSP